MKKRMLSWIMIMALLFGTGLADAAPVRANQSADGAEALLSEEMQDADISSAADEPIETLNVPYQTVEWEPEETDVVESRFKAASAGAASHEIVMVLDVSGSMSGNPITQLKRACYNFIDDILEEDSNAGIAIVTFESSVTAYTFQGSYFSNDRNSLRSVINGLGAGGGTAMNAGLRKADEILQLYGTAANKFIIQMADGEPNSGSSYTKSDARYRYGKELTDPDGNSFTCPSSAGYASEVYNTFLGVENLYHIYSLGFFHGMSGTSKQFAATFMNDIQNKGYFEVIDANNLSFSFEDIAESISSDYLILNKSSLALAKGSSEQLMLSFSSAYTSSDRTVKWGSSNVNIAKVDTNGKVTGVAEGNCVITASAGGYMVTCPVTVGKENEKTRELMTLTVYQNENGQEADSPKYVLSEHAKVEYNGDTYETGSDGRVSIPTVASGEIKVSKEGYSSRIITSHQLAESKKIELQKLSDNPVVNAIWVNNINVLSEPYEIGLTESAATTIAVDIDWGKSKRKSLQLAQEATVVDFSGSSNSISMVLKNKFDISKDLYILVTDQAGHTTKKKLNLEVDSKIEGLDGMGFSIGDSVSFTLPKQLPLIGEKEVSLDAATKALPMTATVDNGKVLITIGIDVDEYTREDKYATNVQTGNRAHVLSKENKVLFDKLKEAATMDDISKSINKLKNIKQRYKTAMKMPQGSFGFTADFTILGYAEGYVNAEGKFEFLDGGVILCPSVSLDWSGQFAIGPIPCYWEAQIAAEVQAQLNLLKSKNNATFLPAGKLEGTLSGSVGGGIGVNKIATIGGGGTLKFEPSATFYSGEKKNYFSLTTSISLYFKVKVACFEYKYEPDPIKSWTVDNGVESIKAEAGPLLGDSLIYETAAYKLEELEYLNGSGAVMQAAAADGDSSVAVDKVIFRENAYSRTEPKLAEFADGTILAVWVDSTSDDVNAIHIYYSYYDGAEWSAPAAIEEDGTADFTPEVCVVDKKAYVIWQNAEQVISTDEGLDTLAPNMGIKAAVFNSLSQAFEETVTLESGNGYLDMMPVIAGGNGTVAAAWIENTANDWFGTSMDGTEPTNQIRICMYENGAWQETQTAYEGLNAVTSLALDYRDGAVYTAYCLDTDNNLDTTEDLELYINGSKVTENDVTDSNPQFFNHVLYWYSDGNIVYTKDLTENSVQKVLTEAGAVLSDEFTVVEDGFGQAVLYLVPEGLGSSIYGIFYQESADAWGSPIRLTNTDEPCSISDFSAIWTKGDEIELLCNRTAVTGTLPEEAIPEAEKESYYDNLYGATDLVLMRYCNPSALTIEDCLYEDADIVPGSTLPLTLTVKNSGTQPIGGVTAEILDEQGSSVLQTEIVQQILSGETAEMEISWLVKAENIGKEYTVRCSPLGRQTADSTGNSCKIVLQYEDVALEELSWGHKNDESVYIYGDIVNKGYSDTGKVTVSLYKDSLETQAVKEYVVENIESMDAGKVMFEVPYEENAIYYAAVSAAADESNYGNNTDYVYLTAPRKDSGRTLTGIRASMDKTSYVAGDTLEAGGITVTAVYSDQTAAAVKDQAFIDISGVNMNVPGTYTIAITYEGRTADITITVSEKKEPPKEDNPVTEKEEDTTIKTGMKIPVNDFVYQVTSTAAGKKTVSVISGKVKSSGKLVIPGSVNIKGTSYKVTAIAAGAFKGKAKLKSVQIPKSVTSIGKEAFKGCKKLSKITGGAGIKTIGKSAFRNCKALTGIKLGASLQTIRESAFAGCKKLKSISIASKKLKKVEKKAFNGISAKAEIKVPAAKLKAYKRLLTKKSVGYKSSWTIKK